MVIGLVAPELNPPRKSHVTPKVPAPINSAIKKLGSGRSLLSVRRKLPSIAELVPLFDSENPYVVRSRVAKADENATSTALVTDALIGLPSSWRSDPAVDIALLNVNDALNKVNVKGSLLKRLNCPV